MWLTGRCVRPKSALRLYRGFESMLIGRDPMDALVIVPRICGICSVSQSAAAASALADAAGLVMPANGRLARNMIQACENVVDHLTHFYCFFTPTLPATAMPACPGTPPWRPVSEPSAARHWPTTCRHVLTSCA